MCIFKVASRRQLDLMMTDAEFVEWKKLPVSIPAYRFAYDNNLLGFSCSLKRDIALSFQRFRRYIQPRNPNKFLLKVLIPKRYSVFKFSVRHFWLI